MSQTKATIAENETPKDSVIHVSPSPHLVQTASSTQKMMIDVLIGLIPVMAASIYYFREYALFQLTICLGSAIFAEWIFVKMRGRKTTLNDGSAIVTGVILALSMPGTAPWYVGTIAAFVAIGIGKIVFGGMGMNLFNPAMVGRAFVMISFAGIMAAAGYEKISVSVDAITQATPMNAHQMYGVITPIPDLFWGSTNGSLGETSALACLVGGLYLIIRKTASWQIPAGMLAALLVIGGIADIAGISGGWTVFHHLFGGAILFGAFFIATDPVTSPLTSNGKWVFGMGVGTLTMVLRLYSGYPEGVMFAVLLMNALTPLINRWMIPTPFGGK